MGAEVTIHGIQNSLKNIIFNLNSVPTVPSFPGAPIVASGFQTQYLKIRNTSGIDFVLRLYGYDTGPNYPGTSTDLDPFQIHYQVLSTTTHPFGTPVYTPNANPSPLATDFTVPADTSMLLQIIDVMDLINIYIVSSSAGTFGSGQLLASVRNIPI
jgi:hypothetical protein